MHSTQTRTSYSTYCICICKHQKLTDIILFKIMRQSEAYYESIIVRGVSIFYGLHGFGKPTKFCFQQNRNFNTFVRWSCQIYEFKNLLTNNNMLSVNHENWYPRNKSTFTV